MKNFQIIILIFVIGLNTLFAHDHWISYTPPNPSAGDTLHIIIASGHEFPESSFGLKDNLASDVEVTLPDKSQLFIPTKSQKAQISNGNTYCPRYDDMCGLTFLAGYNDIPQTGGSGWPDGDIDEVTKLRGQFCPPTAGGWDDLQILQLAGIKNLPKIPDEYKTD